MIFFSIFIKLFEIQKKPVIIKIGKKYIFKEKKNLKNLSILAMTFILFLTTFSGVADASYNEKVVNKQIDELAESLEFIFEEAAIKDEMGNIVSLDIGMIEEQFGPSPEIELLKQQLGPKSRSAAVDRCIENKIKTGYGDLVSGAVFGAIIDDILDNNYTSAAKRLIKLGVRGTPAGIASSVAGMFLTCLVTHGNNPWN